MPSTRKSIRSTPAPRACPRPGSNIKPIEKMSETFLANMGHTSGFSTRKLKLFADSNTDMPSHRRLNSVPLLCHGKINAEPKRETRVGTEVCRPAEAKNVPSAIGLTRAADALVSSVLPDHLRTNPPFSPNRMRLVRTVGKEKPRIEGISEPGVLRSLGSAEIVDRRIRDQLFHMKKTGVRPAKIQKKVRGT